MLLNVPEFKVSKMTLKDESGKVITNADGTERYYYFITDAEAQRLGRGNGERCAQGTPQPLWQHT